MLRLDPAERASVPEIFNHFWLRGSGNGVVGPGGAELKWDRSGGPNSTVFQSVSSLKDLSLPPKEKSDDKKRFKNPDSLTVMLDEVVAMLEPADSTLAGEVVKTESFTPPPTAVGASNENATSPQLFKLVPLRRTGTQNQKVDSPSSDDSRPTTGRGGAKPRSSLQEADSLRDLTETVGRASLTHDPLAYSTITPSRVGSGRFVRDRSATAASAAEISGIVPKESRDRKSMVVYSSNLEPSVHSEMLIAHSHSPKTSRPGSGTFFSAGTASLNTHLGGTVKRDVQTNGKPYHRGDLK